jgi:hypothetical protein
VVSSLGAGNEGIVAKTMGKNWVLLSPATLVFLLNKSPFLFLQELSREMFYTPVFTHHDLCPFYKLISGFLLSL